MRKGIHSVNLKKQMKICYSIFNMSSCRKPEIQNALPKITKVKLICYFYQQNFDPKSLTMLILVFETTIQFHF